MFLTTTRAVSGSVSFAAERRRSVSPSRSDSRAAFLIGSEDLGGKGNLGRIRGRAAANKIAKATACPSSVSSEAARDQKRETDE